MERSDNGAFAVWITGLPAAGKSTVAAVLKTLLNGRKINVATLESDTLRQIFTPQPRYDEAERDLFYRQITFVGALLARHGVPVIFDATANRRSYRDAARKEIPHFVEVYVECPPEVCRARDPKGIYQNSGGNMQGTVPGVQVPYEPPEDPDVRVRGDQERPAIAAHRIIEKLDEKGYL